MVLFVFLLTGSAIAQITVSGAGSSIVNGIYLLSEYTPGGKVCYTRSSDGYTIMWETDRWILINGPGSIRYYYNTANTLTPPNVGWQVGVDGTKPAPVAGGSITSLLVGDGSSGSPYQISSLNSLYWIAKNDTAWDNYFIQTADIDAAETSEWAGGGWTPIGNLTTRFSGSYDGQYFSISGLSIDRGDYVQGLFGFADDAALVQNVRVVNVNIASTLGESGGLIGSNRGTVINCSSTGGSVHAWYDAGGLVGLNYPGSISNSSSSVTVSGNEDTGGLVGRTSNGSVTNCYSTGSVSGIKNVGGFAGQNNAGTISNCYSSGAVSGTSSVGGLAGLNNSTVSNSFWDTETSGKETSAGGTGKTTIEMKTQSTFIDAGWENTIWCMDAGINSGYPFLLWENPSGSPLPVELTSFTASTNGRGMELIWKTATEANNYGFEIEKKAVSSWPLANSQQLNANDWSKIGFVEGNGTTNSPKSYNFVDVSAQGKVAYRLKQIDRDGKFTYSNQVEAMASVISNYALAQNHPNPFNPSTVISYQLPMNGYVTLKVYDMIGKEIATLVNGMQEAGEHTTSFNASHLPSGLYFYSLQSKNFNATKKMLLVK